MNGQNKLVFYIKLVENACQGQYSSLLGPFVSNEGKKVSWAQPLGQYSQHFIFFVTYKLVQ
jgi:hypothetical protein